MYKDSQLRKIQSLTIRSLESLKRFSQRRHPRRHVSFFSFSLASTHIYMHTHTHTLAHFSIHTADKVEWTTMEAEVDERKKGGQVGREMTVRLSGSWTTRFISISTKGFIHVYDHTWTCVSRDLPFSSCAWPKRRALNCNDSSSSLELRTIDYLDFNRIDRIARKNVRFKTGVLHLDDW